VLNYITVKKEPVTRASTVALDPVSFLGQFRHECTNLIPDLPHNFDGLTLS